MPSMLAGQTIGLLTASASRLGGGVFEAVVKHVEMIRSLGGTARVFALEDRHSGEDRTRFGDVQVTACAPVGPGQVGYAPALVPALMAANLDCLHLHGIWMYPSRAGAVWAQRTGRPYLISPHGMLDRWITARGRWKKALARVGYERASWRAATALHALTRREADDIERESGRSDSIVIPNAGPDTGPEVSLSAPAPRGPHVTYIGRIHAKKNLLPLVDAWTAARLPEGSRLSIAGWGDDGDVAALRAAVARAGASVAFVGPVFGAAKQALLADSRFVVLPSLSEGLPMAILEAWAAGVPTIMTEECNLPEGLAAGAAITCGYDAAAIRRALETALALDPQGWQAMAAAATGLANGPFSAAQVSRRWGQAYRDALGLDAVAGRGGV